MAERPRWFDSMTHDLYGWWAGPLIDISLRQEDGEKNHEALDRTVETH